jgi:ABC-type polysaccharide/polyol phosphate export permease
MAQEAEPSQHTVPSEHTVSNRAMELLVSGLFVAASCLVMYDNWRIGARWGEDGPQAGYFPFYIGIIMFVASATTFGTHLLARHEGSESFVGRSELVRVVQVLVPTVVYVLLITYLGLYVSSAIFIAFFMAWLGKYPLYKILPVAILIPVALFFMFEVWFLVPLPKGPLETALGY